MTEITVKLDVPQGLEDRVAVAVQKALKEFLEEVEFSLANEILEESELTEDHSRELGKEVNVRVAKKYF